MQHRQRKQTRFKPNKKLQNVYIAKFVLWQHAIHGFAQDLGRILLKLQLCRPLLESTREPAQHNADSIPGAVLQQSQKSLHQADQFTLCGADIASASTSFL